MYSVRLQTATDLILGGSRLLPPFHKNDLGALEWGELPLNISIQDCLDKRVVFLF